MLFWKKRGKNLQETNGAGEGTEGPRLSGRLDANLSLIKSAFYNVDTIQYRELQSSLNAKLKFCLIYNDGMVDSKAIDEYILKPLMHLEALPRGSAAADLLANQTLHIDNVKKLSTLKEITEGLAYGNSLLLIDHCDEALMLDTKNFVTRSIQEPDGEMVLSGPREGFCESLLINLSLIRRKLRSSELKMKYLSLGRRTETQVCVAYIESIVNKPVLEELMKRLKVIDIDGVLDANYINEFIRDNSRSIFRSIGYTERPDIVAGKLLEGRVAVFVDGTPVVLTVPFMFIENFQSNEDYYLNYYYTTYMRILRIVGFLLSITIPAFFIATITYHQEMLPTKLMISIAADSFSVPLPASVEVFILLVMFDILRESGIRMSSRIGQALSIVGALVVGQAAVAAKLVSAPMIIVVAATGITSLLIPKIDAPTIYIRLGLLLCASCFGFLGLTLGLSVVVIHILSLESFGISQITRDDQSGLRDAKDIFIRAPWWRMRTRPSMLSENQTRLGTHEEKRP